MKKGQSFYLVKAYTSTESQWCVFDNKAGIKSFIDLRAGTKYTGVGEILKVQVVGEYEQISHTEIVWKEEGKAHTPRDCPYSPLSHLCDVCNPVETDPPPRRICGNSRCGMNIVDRRLKCTENSRQGRLCPDYV
jgi:hypothetical protein